MSSNLNLTLKPRQCQTCHAGAGLEPCSACTLVYYCSPECQASDQDSHKRPCTVIKDLVSAFARTEQKLRYEENQCNLQDNQNWYNNHRIRHGMPPRRLQDFFFGSTDEENCYMSKRLSIAEETLANFKSTDAVQASLDHLTEMLSLCDGQELVLRHRIPALFLRLGRDQECYDFIEYWATKTHIDSYEWPNTNQPYLESRNADVLESPLRLWTDIPIDLTHAICVVLIKVRILLDLQHMQNANRAFQEVLPRELIDQIRGQALVSSVVASRKDIIRAPLGKTAELVELVKGQIKFLFDLISRHDQHFWPALVDYKEPERDTMVVLRYAARALPDGKARVAAGFNIDAWRETPGAIGVIKTLMKMA